LERKLRDEENQNEKLFKQIRLGDYVEYGNIVQLYHVNSKSFVEATKTCADEDTSCNKIELNENGSKSCYFYALGGFKYKQKGDRIHYNDQIIFKNAKLGLYLHVSERLLKIDLLDALPSSL
jgi:hypothetical protein